MATTYTPSVRCPMCGGVQIRTTQTRKTKAVTTREHECQSKVRRLGKIVTCGHKFKSRETPPPTPVDTVDQLLTELLENPKPRILTAIRDDLNKRGITTVAKLVNYIKANA